MLQAEPNSVDLHNELGLVLQEQGELAGAIGHFRAAATLAPDRAVLHHNLGNALYRQGDLAAAEASLRRALELEPSLAEPAVALGNVLKARDLPEAALAAYDRALTAAPDHVLAHYNHACLLQSLKQHDAAATGFGRVLALDPGHARAFDARVTARLQACNWDFYAEDIAVMRARIAAGTGDVAPFASLALPLTQAEQLDCARSFVAATAPAQRRNGVSAAARAGDCISPISQPISIATRPPI